jgi:hypothetical protein
MARFYSYMVILFAFTYVRLFTPDERMQPTSVGVMLHIGLSLDRPNQRNCSICEKVIY